jgi:hypothetical protein
MRTPIAPVICSVLLAAHGLARATVVWSDNFAGQTAGIQPSLDYPGGAAGNDYAVIALTEFPDWP